MEIINITSSENTQFAEMPIPTNVTDISDTNGILFINSNISLMNVSNDIIPLSGINTVITME
jgi:hypothetical protein